MYLIVGLGNPGEKYKNTRHNMGFWFVDRLAQQMGINVKKLKFKSLAGDGTAFSQKVVLLKPQTYMNLSGEAVFDAAQYYKIEPQNIIVVYDDAALSLGRIRIRQKGSDGGHNGMKSIIYMLESDEFLRIRIGIGAPKNKNFDLADWVLSDMPKESRDLVDETLSRTLDALKLILEGDVQTAMGIYNADVSAKEKHEENAQDGEIPKLF